MEQESKRTPMYEKHIELNAKMVEFAGYDMPIQYTGISDEHNWVRTKAGLFDVSHMGEIIVEGDDAGIFLDYLVTNDVLSMKENQIIYSPMCYEDGGTIDDLLIYKMMNTKYLIIVNASNLDKDYKWITEHKGNYFLGIENHSENYGLIALQGPLAETVLQKYVNIDLSTIEYYHFRQNFLCFEQICLISRTGYTGEDGFEIMAKNHIVKMIFDELLKEDLVKPCGLGARDTLRFEAAMPLYGHELTKDINPIITGLSYFIKKDRNFIGKSSLEAYTKSGNRQKLVGCELIGKGIGREGYEVFNKEGDRIGYITTGYKSPTLGKAIAMCIVDYDYSTLGTSIYIKIREKLVEGKVIKKRFLSSVK